MAVTTYNCVALTGGGTRALDAISVSDLSDNDRAFVDISGIGYRFLFDATDTSAENTSTHPYKVRPDDYSTAGVWIEQEVVPDLHASSHIRAGSDEIDGDKLDIDFTPSNYTPNTSPAEVTNADELTAHLAGIDNELGRQVNLLANSGFGVWSNSTLENVGSDLVTNGGFTSDTSGWTAVDCTLASVAGGQSGNCLELTRTASPDQTAHSNTGASTTISGKLYKLTVYVKSGTSGDEAFLLRVVGVGTATVLALISGTSSGTWTQYSAVFESDDTNLQIQLRKNTATAGTMLFDTVTLYEVTPACIAADAKAMDGWTKTSTLDITRVQNDTTHCKGLYGVKVTKGVDTAEYLTWQGNIYNKLEHYSKFTGLSVTLGCWVYSVTATDNVKVEINDSDGTSASSFVGADSLTWKEIARSVGGTITSFSPRFLFDGTTGDIAYISRPMLVVGSSIGEGNYVAPQGEIVWLENQIVLTDFNGDSFSTVGSTTTINLEAQSNGVIPKGIQAIFASVWAMDSDTSTGSPEFRIRNIQDTGNQIFVNVDFADAAGRDDKLSTSDGLIVCDGDGDIGYRCTASGADTLDVYIYVTAVYLR